MTREEAIDGLKSVRTIHNGNYAPQIDEAIKLLEQEPILDKIRAEIENHCGLEKENHCRTCSYCNIVMGVREILEIIDKHKVESKPERELKNECK